MDWYKQFESWTAWFNSVVNSTIASCESGWWRCYSVTRSSICIFRACCFAGVCVIQGDCWVGLRRHRRVNKRRHGCWDFACVITGRLFKSQRLRAERRERYVANKVCHHTFWKHSQQANVNWLTGENLNVKISQKGTSQSRLVVLLCEALHIESVLHQASRIQK